MIYFLPKVYHKDKLSATNKHVCRWWATDSWHNLSGAEYTYTHFPFIADKRDFKPYFLLFFRM